MIKTQKGRTTLAGTIGDIASDFTCIVDSYKDALINKMGMTEEEAVKHIKECVEFGLMTKEELQKKVKEDVSEFLMKLCNALKNDAEEEKADE